MKTDFALRLRRRCHEFADSVEDGLDLGIVLFDLVLEFRKLMS